MADELNLDEDKDSESITRIKELSHKVKITSQERDDLASLKAKADTERDSAIKERDFYSSFSDVSAQYPNAKDHKDDIKAKVLAGYSVEDAAVSVLAKAGKLTGGSQAQASKTDSAGGSAATNVQNGAKKSVADMSQAERRAALMESLDVS